MLQITLRILLKCVFLLIIKPILKLFIESKEEEQGNHKNYLDMIKLNEEEFNRIILQSSEDSQNRSSEDSSDNGSKEDSNLNDSK